jgi:5-methylthioadenosine/S-adenosylhomocysteine deaminase
MSHKILLKGGTVLSMDPEIGDLPTGDVLIEDDRIVAVQPSIEADAEVVDATGRIVIPGFVDSHRHTWEAAIRGCAPNATLDDYFVEVLDTFAPLYQPEDVYASNVAGALECLNAGITTLVDWSHINNTPEHPDAAVTGLRDSGIRAQYAYGSANTSLAKYWFNSAEVIPADDVRRIRETYAPGDDGLITMAVATRGPGFCQDDVVTAEWQMARELGLPITVHVAMGRLAGRFAMVEQLDRLGLLGPDITYVHSCYFSEHEWQRVADTGGTISIAAQVELQMGHGWPPVGKSYQFGMRPSLSIDVVTTVPGDMFTQMRAAFGAERARVNATCWEANTGVPDTMPTARTMLEMATINGAHVAGLEDRTGSLTPGKKADVVLVDARAVNVAPVIDPVAAVVLCADVSNIETVLVDGRFRKRDGVLLADLDKVISEVTRARDRLTSAAGAAAAEAAEAANEQAAQVAEPAGGTGSAEPAAP